MASILARWSSLGALINRDRCGNSTNCLYFDNALGYYLYMETQMKKTLNKKLNCAIETTSYIDLNSNNLRRNMFRVAEDSPLCKLLRTHQKSISYKNYDKNSQKK